MFTSSTSSLYLSEHGEVGALGGGGVGEGQSEAAELELS